MIALAAQLGNDSQFLHATLLVFSCCTSRYLSLTANIVIRMFIYCQSLFLFSGKKALFDIGDEINAVQFSYHLGNRLCMKIYDVVQVLSL